MIQAQELSNSDGRSHPDTADLLLAVVRTAGSAAARALQGVGAGEERVRSALAGVERSESPVEGIGPSAELKTVIETAFHGVGYPARSGRISSSSRWPAAAGSRAPRWPRSA